MKLLDKLEEGYKIADDWIERNSEKITKASLATAIVSAGGAVGLAGMGYESSLYLLSTTLASFGVAGYSEYRTVRSRKETHYF